jgi:hypothetical protein
MKSRREFLRSAGTAAAGAALAALAGKLLLGGHDAPSRDGEHVCRSDGYCRKCNLLSGCILPQAQSARRIAEPKP